MQRHDPVRLGQKLYRRFHCFPPRKLLRVPLARRVPKVLVQVGELRGLIYRSDRGQPGRPRSFVHFFQNPPLLTSDPRGKQLHIVGGNYRVTRRGIEG